MRVKMDEEEVIFLEQVEDRNRRCNWLMQIHVEIGMCMFIVHSQCDLCLHLRVWPSVL